MIKRREEVLEEMLKGDKKKQGPQGGSGGAFLQGIIPGFLNR